MTFCGGPGNTPRTPRFKRASPRPAARGTGISVPVYQRTSRFAWANSVKPEVFGTYQKIPGTGHLEPSICKFALRGAKTGRRRVKLTSRGEKRDERRAREREGATGVYERGFARDV